jgi:hypothetical protein
LKEFPLKVNVYEDASILQGWNYIIVSSEVFISPLKGVIIVAEDGVVLRRPEPLMRRPEPIVPVVQRPR